MTTLVTIPAPHYAADGKLIRASTTWSIAFDDSGLDTYRTSRGLLPGDAGKVQDKDSVLLALAKEVHQLLAAPATRHTCVLADGRTLTVSID